MAKQKNVAAIVKMSAVLKCTSWQDEQELSWIKSLESVDLGGGLVRTTLVIEAYKTEVEDWKEANFRKCVDDLRTPRQWRLAQGFSS
jgi:hypothetical protein